ncbi:MAG: ferritin family protein [Bacteroidales bacterium]|nr:ferritin family protein [Bacteroidales bacterium]
MKEEKTLEILKMALLMEHRGKAFYKKIAEQTTIEDVKKIFNLMADEEQLHIEFLGKQFSSYKKTNKFDFFSLKEDGEIAKLVLSEDMKKQISASGFEAAAISAAIDMENKAISVYSERAEAAVDVNEKALYSWLANWEKDHLTILADLNKELTEKIWYDNNFWPY